MTTDIVFPEFAEDGDEVAKVVSWMVEPGSKVEEDEEVLELLTDKATFTVPAPAKGVVEALVKEGDEITVGTVLGRIRS